MIDKKRTLVLFLFLLMFTISGLCLDGYYKLRNFDKQKNESFSFFVSSCSDLGTFDNKDDFQTDKTWFEMSFHNYAKSENPTCINHFCFFDSSFKDQKFSKCKKLAENVEEYFNPSYPYIGGPVEKTANAAEWGSMLIPIGGAEVVGGKLTYDAYKAYKASRFAKTAQQGVKEAPIQRLSSGKGKLLSSGSKAVRGAAIKGEKIHLPKKVQKLRHSIPVKTLGIVVGGGVLLGGIIYAGWKFVLAHKYITLIVCAIFAFLLIRKLMRKRRRKV